MIKSKNTLYICGAGTSSAFTAGMLKELESQGMTNTFDTVVGASSGAFSACFFVSNSATQGAAGYWKMLPSFYKNKTFFNIWNIFKFKPVMNVRHLVNYGLSDMSQNAINWKAIINSNINKQGRLFIQVVDAKSGHIVLASHFKTQEALRDIVAASCSIPVIAGLSPFKLKASTLNEVTLTNHMGQTMQPKHMGCYDGDVSDMYARTARGLIQSESTIMLTIAHPNHDNKCFPMGKWFIWLEFIAAYPLFFPHFKAIFAYQNECLWGRGKREFNKLHVLTKQNPNKMLLVGIPQNINTHVNVFSVKAMKQSVQTGQGVMKKTLLLLK